ncbi:hypothetical protein [Nocardioides alkalitolerans]|uniref:hypothetical protein n=1 Tax=Nocardioides alkalitolerans TaxID=281714 RepID=UPI00041C4930|nr:hypothetical protein [Nocardioides alkalitolerans]
MSTLDHLAQSTGATSQATAIEQARAVAEVAASIEAALRYPRDLDRAFARMERVCASYDLAQRAFYAVTNRGSGPSVHLARALAACYGNTDHGIVELRRDDDAHVSEVQAFAWDKEHNVRSTRSFIVPHARMARGSRQTLTDLTDIVNNNNNAGARAVRETIFTVLPPDYVEKAKRLCRATLERGDGTSLEDRIRQMVAAFARGDVTEQMLEQRAGRERSRWDAQDVAELGVLFESLRSGDITKAQAFPQTAAGLDESQLPGREVEGPTDDGSTAASRGDRERPEVAPSTDTPAPATGAQRRMVTTLLGELGVKKTDTEETLLIVSKLADRGLTALEDLTGNEAEHVLDQLRQCDDRAALDLVLDDIDRATA